MVVQGNAETIRLLAEQARSGDRAAFSELVKLLMNPIVALTHKMTGSREVALDLAQESFISAWQNIGSFRGDAKFESWLYRIAVNKSLHHLESAKTRSSVRFEDAGADVAAASTPELQLTREELRRDVLNFMLRLPEQQRAVFELRFYKQYQFDEIATITGKALGTVKTLYREAVKKLRVEATEKGWRS